MHYGLENVLLWLLTRGRKEMEKTFMLSCNVICEKISKEFSFF